MTQNACWLLTLLAVGCGSSTRAVDVDATAATNDARIGPDALTTPDGTGQFVEAAHGAVPVVLSNGGPVLTAPTVLPIFFAGDDAAQGQIEELLTGLSTTNASLWTEMTAEYGVGPLSILPTIVTTDAAPTTEDELRAWLTSNADGTHAGWPAPTANTIYTVILPTAAFTGNLGTACVDFGAFHSDITIPESTSIVFSLVARCPATTNDSIEDHYTSGLVHELVESSTDPLFNGNPAYRFLDEDHSIWYFRPGAELGDMCEHNAPYERFFGNFYMQRIWSNAAAQSGHDPCVPSTGLPYVSASLVMPDDEVIVTDSDYATKGVSIPLGTSKVIEVDLFSDVPTVDWKLTALNVDVGDGGGSDDLMFSWDNDMGNNGDKRYLTITRLTNGAIGGSEVEVDSIADNTSHGHWYGFIAN